MTRKFDDIVFMTTFQSLLEDQYTNFKYPPVILNLSRLARQTCQQLNYAQWKNRETINTLIRAWWNNLPKARDERYEHRLFERDCRMSRSGRPTFVWVRHTSGVQAVDLIMFKNWQ